MVDTASRLPATARVASAAEKHIVDVLIEERAPKLSASPIWPVLRPALYRILNYERAVRLADTIRAMPGREALDWLTDDLALRVASTGLERIPRQGPFFIVANHPTGIADGIAVYEAVRKIRPDVMIYANSDAHRVCPDFSGSLIPVEWVPEKRTRERTRLTLRLTSETLAAGAPILIFPAGRLARVRADGRLTDPEWQSSAVSLARKHDLPILPCHVSGPYALLFHAFDKVSKELRDITLFHELLNKEGRLFDLIIGKPIAPEALAGDAETVTLQLKNFVEWELPEAPDAAFAPR